LKLADLWGTRSALFGGTDEAMIGGDLGINEEGMSGVGTEEGRGASDIS
jgi:hypothetical protein